MRLRGFFNSSGYLSTALDVFNQDLFRHRFWMEYVFPRKKLFLIILLIIALLAFPVDISFAEDFPPDDPHKKGIALTGSQPGDVDLLKADWWYVYSVWEVGLEYDNYVPMLTEGTVDPSLSSSWDGYILVFNEPSLQNISPELGANRYLELHQAYPHATLVLAGVVEANILWAQEFLSYLEVENYPQRWAVHHYFTDDETIAIQDIQAFYDLVQVPMWVTEFGSISADHEANSRFIAWMDSVKWIHRYAYFPTRMNKDFPWFPPSWSDDMALVEWSSGHVTEMGEVFRDHGHYQVFIPYIISDGLFPNP
jgi:hypothetical protein